MFEDVKASGWFWPGVVLPVLVFGPFLLHPPTAWTLKNIAFPTVLAALLMALAATGDRIGWCFVIPLITAPWIVWDAMQARWYIRRLPHDVEMTGIIELGVEEDILSGCGAVIHGLAPSTLDALRAAEAGERRHLGGYSARFSTWLATLIPIHDNQHWQMGVGLRSQSSLATGDRRRDASRGRLFRRGSQIVGNQDGGDGVPGEADSCVRLPRPVGHF